MPFMLSLRTAGGKAEDAARIDSFERQSAGYKRIKYPVECDAVSVGHSYFNVRMA